MTEFLLLIGGALLGAAATALVLLGRRASADTARVALHGQVAALTAVETELRALLQSREAELAAARAALQAESSLRSASDARAAESLANIDQQRRLLESSEQRLREAFGALAHESLQKNADVFVRAAEEKVRPLKDALEKLDQQVRAVEQVRQEAYGRVTTQLEQLGTSNMQLSQQTASLVTALRTPHVRGRWGEVTLQRAVEAAGLSPHCDFQVQSTVGDTDNRQRPDLIVRLPGQRTIVVDSKAPLAGFLDALETADQPGREEKLALHSRQLRAHLQNLSAKRYWQQFERSPDFVVMFLPTESCFAAAIERDRTLLEDGIAARVIPASPTSLIALLRTVAHTWQQQAVVENAQEIGKTARELFERVCRFGEHMLKMGDGLRRSTESYNEAVGSWERRVLPMAMRVTQLGATLTDAELPLLPHIDSAPRTLSEPLLRPRANAE